MFERALALHRVQGDPVAIGRALTRLALVVHRLGDPRCEELLAEAVELLEAQPPGPELVAAYTYAAGRGMFTNEHAKTIAGSDRALALAAELGLPAPAMALHMRGVSRCHLGDSGGIDDLREALRLALQQGLGRETAVIQGNLSEALSLSHGPQVGLDALRESIEFCERRGITEMVLQNRSGIPGYLAELGQTEQALAEAGPLADLIEAGGDMSWVVVRALQLHLLAETGAAEKAPESERVISAARATGLPDWIAIVLAFAAELLLAQGERGQARALLAEIDANAAVRAACHYVLPEAVRTALALGDASFARSLVADVEPRRASVEHGLASARAQLAEAEGDHPRASSLYADTAERWREFGNVPERAYALLGQGRCLVTLGDAAAEVPLAEARELFAAMGYEPALAETEKLLADAIAKTA